MATISGPCGHCKKDAALQLTGAYPIKRLETGEQLWGVLTRCFHCAWAGYAVVIAPRQVGATPPTNADRNIEDLGWKVIERGPVPTEPVAPLHAPEDVGRAYVQAALNQTAAPELCIIGCRRALELALRHKGAEEGTLAARIEVLRKDGKISAELAEWAHHIRELGNAAAHEADGISEAPEHAGELLEFTRLVLMYLFTLPGMIESARRRDRSQG